MSESRQDVAGGDVKWYSSIRTTDCWYLKGVNRVTIGFNNCTLGLCRQEK